MRGSPTSMQFLRPRTADEALRLLAQDPSATPLAGGTDLMVLFNAGQLNGRTILDLSAIEAWQRLRKRGPKMSIGALASLRRLQEHPVLRQAFPLLLEACAVVGAVQIQNRATLGGNIANASPAGDSFPPLAVYEAIVRVASIGGRRSVPFLQIFAGVKQTTLQPGELITAIEVPLVQEEPSRQMFRKVGTRAAQAISKVVAAGLLWLHADSRVKELRFALGSMAPTVRRLWAVEETVRNQELTPAVIDECCTRLEQDVSPIDDVRSTRDYRLMVARNLLRAFLCGKGA